MLAPFWYSLLIILSGLDLQSPFSLLSVSCLDAYYEPGCRFSSVFFFFYLSGHIDARMEIKRPRRDHTSSDLFLNHGRGLWPIFKLFNSVVCQQTWLPLLVTKRTKRYISLKCFQKAAIFLKKPSKLNQ